MKIGNLEVYGIIYKIINLINKKVYIGQTIQGFKDRYRNNLENNTHNIHLKNAIHKYGIENFEIDKKFDIAFSKEELDIKEKCWICIYDSINPKYGYNKQTGGANGIPNEETRKKQGVISKKLWQNEEYRNKIYKNNIHNEDIQKKKSKLMSGTNNPMYGKNIYTNKSAEELKLIKIKLSLRSKKQWRDEKYRNYMSELAKGRNPYVNKTDEEMKIIRLKMSRNHADINGEKNPNYQNYWTEEQKQEASKKMIGRFSDDKNPNASKMYIYDLNGNIVFSGIIKHCCEWLINKKYLTTENGARQSIHNCIKQNKKYNDIIFSKEKIDVEKINKIIIHSRKLDIESKEKMNVNKRGVICITDNYKYFNTITECSEYYNIDGSSISKCCRGKLKSLHKHKFMYYDDYIKQNELLIHNENLRQAI